MKYKASYFSVSIPLVKENLRRFWAIPVIGFLAYFLSSAFPILMSYNNINNMYNYIEMCLTNNQPFFLCVHLVMPVITAVIIFRYIQNSSAVTAIHSMPFTRAQLFNSNLISGLILIILPLIANELILQVIAKPTYDYYMYVDYDKMSALGDNAINIFTRSNVLHWFWQSLLIVLVIYAISVFAGMVTGNTVMHLSLAFGFNFLAPALYLTFITYCSSYLFGFTSTGTHEEILLGLSPFTQVSVSNGIFSLPMQTYYLILSLGIIIISSLLYQKRQMENSGESIVFNFMIPAICYLISYFGMTLMGLYYISFSSNSNALNNDTYFYAGLISGAIISFILGRMIVLKTPRIFNIQSLKSFCLFAVIASIFICSITFDLMGFENRVPVIDKVHGIMSTNFNFSNNIDRYQSELFKIPKTKIKENQLHYTDPKNVEALIALHQEIVNQKNKIQKEEKLNVQSSEISFYYSTSNPFGIQRSYYLTNSRMAKNKYLKQLYESLEFKHYFSFKNLNYDKISNITLTNQFFNDQNTNSKLIIHDNNKINNLLKAMEKDFQDRTYEEFISNIHPYCNLLIDYTYLDENGNLLKGYLNMNVLLTDTHTINWLKENSYSTYLECNADMIERIVFIEQNSEKNQDLEKIEIKKLVITDKEQIQKILDTYSCYQTDYTKYFEGYITYKQNHSAVETYPNIYYDNNAAPRFISSYFN